MQDGRVVAMRTPEQRIVFVVLIIVVETIGERDDLIALFHCLRDP